MAVVQARESEAEPGAEQTSGLAHLAAVSFLASRLAPTAGFWVALAGGVAVARAAASRGLRTGIGASLAALAQSVAIMGPARLSIPLTQALTAPLVGWMEARRTAASAQVAAVAALRVALAFFWTAILIWIILGGLDAYTGGYDWLTERLDWLPQGDSGALVLTAVGIVVWGLFASVVQVLVYRRGLRRWPEATAGEAVPRPAPGPRAPRRRLDPRAVATAACVAWAVLLASADWPLLLAVIAWLAVAWLVAQPERDFVPVGAVLAGVLALSALIAGVLASLPLETTLERAGRAGLLVAVATWFRAAAGTAGIREVSQRVLGRLARVLPGASEAGRILGDLGSADVLLPAGRTLADELNEVRRRPRPMLDGVLRWVADESGRFRPAPKTPSPALAIRARDVALVALAAAPVALLVTGVASPGAA